jgi:hypothetical protein
MLDDELRLIIIHLCYISKHDLKWDEKKAREEYLGINIPSTFINSFKATVDYGVGAILRLIGQQKDEDENPFGKKG